jgi:hypothetical protein
MVSTWVSKPQVACRGARYLVNTAGKTTRANDNVELALAA